MINVEVKREGSESISSLVRRFSKRVGGAGIVRLAKSRQYQERAQSEFKQKKSALRRIAKRAKVARLRKLGEIKQRTN